MKYILTLLFTTQAFAAYYPAPSVAKYDNLAAIDKAFDASNSVVYRNATISSATDPFAGKTNKYAETAAIMLTCSGKGAHIKFGAAAPTATTSDFYVPVDSPTVFKVDSNKPYVSIIEDAATAICYTVELK